MANPVAVDFPSHNTPPEMKNADRNKKGCYSYRDLDHRISGPVTVGGASFGKVGVDVKWRFKDSKWGSLDVDRHPAGVLYLDVCLRQPGHCSLDSATITITLEDTPANSRTCADAVSLSHQKIPVHMTNHYGPRHILGPERTRSSTKGFTFQPHFEAFGFGFGGVGSSSRSVGEVPCQFSFVGNLRRPSGHPGGVSHYKTLEWNLTESDLEPSQTSTIHTAFAFAHSGEPFYMDVMVRGELRRKRDQFKDGFRNLKFGPRPGRPGDVSSTYVGRYHGQRSPLDELAERLDWAMREANRQSMPTVMSQASFGEVRPQSRLVGTPSTGLGMGEEQGRRPVITPSQPGVAGQLEAPPTNRPADPFQFLISTPESEMRKTLDELADGGHRFLRPAARASHRDILEPSNMSTLSGTAPSLISNISKDSTLSHVSSTATLVDEADQIAAAQRVTDSVKKKAAPTYTAPIAAQGKLDMEDEIAEKQKAVMGAISVWAIVMYRVILQLMGMPP